ncbi:LysR family transcriptional regulator [Celeribacter indicus]|uniref:LysR family transcriptional regulator n=1 Tax=Celeribacter indicus TaxID=1208324 RepID=A0A0B5DUP3_9RHOB|nr:LysR family transcriptional regulator [Celeribacter indicus]AJE46744.1 LysR family transcriptional regulator [Celeribacter indicus]SDX05401.1 DNA-binding transcriptional regulator, LysR family [Celeribacter indicus]
MIHNRLLKYLDEVTRAGSIRKAAVRLNVASSAVNRRIIELEEDLGTPIFERLPRGLRLTAAGEILIQHVRTTLREHEHTIARINGLKGLMRGDVTVVTMAGLAPNLLAEALAEFRSEHSRIKVRVRILTGDRIVHAVAAGEADLGLGYNLPASSRLTRVLDIHQQLGAAMSPDHPLATKREIRLADCIGYPIVAAEIGLSLRATVELLVPPDIEFEPIIETDSLELMKRLARLSPNLAVLNRADVDLELREGSLAFVPFSAAKGQQTISLVHRSRGPLEPAASMLAHFIERSFAARSGLG